MAQTLGIKLSVDVKQLLESIKTAIDKINDGRLDSKELKLYTLLKNYFGKLQSDKEQCA
ncbi:MAG: hypothetical protein HDT42_02950 [Ruminococcaceae bacterium]|nr:hypothetical protein [Oscillospiraceae bacterium]